MLLSMRPIEPFTSGPTVRTSKLRPVGALEAECRPCFLRRRDLVAKLFDQAARLRDLLGIAFRKLAATNVQAVLETDAHVTAHHHGLRGKRHLVSPGPQHRPGIIL